MFKILIVGKPNGGKTTLFNALCRQNEITGNWHGVSSKVKKSGYKFKNERYEVYDLPGIESLTPDSLEERAALDHIEGGDFDLIVVVSEVTKVNGGASLAAAFSKKGYNVLLALTKTDKFLKSGGKIDDKLLWQNAFPIYVDSYKRSSVEKLKKRISDREFCPVKPCDKSYILFEPKEKKDFLLNPFIALSVFSVIVLICFYTALGRYSVGAFCSAVISRAGNFIGASVASFCASRFTPFLTKVIVCISGGVFAVVEFLPQAIIFEFFLFFIEESGLSQRLACAVGEKFCKYGLGLKCIFPLLSGLGCSAVACRLCSCAENENIKKKAVKLLPFIPCSAKTLALTFICKSLFRYPALAMVIAYLLQAGMACVIILIERLLNGANNAPFILFVSPMNFPPLKIVFKKTMYFVGGFLSRIAFAVFLTSFAIGITSNVTTQFSLALDINESILAFIGKKTAKLFAFAGIEDWRAVTALLAGAGAKECFIGVASELYPSGFTLPFSDACCLLVFFSLYSPCVVALSSFARETGRLNALKMFIKSTVYGYIGAFLTKNTLNSNYYPLIFFALSFIIVVGVCYAVKKGCGNKRRKTIRSYGERGDKLQHPL